VIRSQIKLIIKQNWNRFLSVVKATALKQQFQTAVSTNSKHIYDKPLTDINVIERLCVEFADKIFDICRFRSVAFTTERN